MNFVTILKFKKKSEISSCDISFKRRYFIEINENVLLEPISQKISSVLAWGTFAIEGMTLG